MNNKCFTEYTCKKCGYIGEDRSTHFFYDNKGQEEENIIDETSCCPICGEYEEFQERRF